MWERRGGKRGEDMGGGRDGKGGQGRGPPIFYCTSQFQFSRNMPGTCSARDKIMSPWGCQEHKKVGDTKLQWG